MVSVVYRWVGLLREGVFLLFMVCKRGFVYFLVLYLIGSAVLDSYL